jgi:hypothetical protein
MTVFQREVPTDTHNKPDWNTWTRTSKRDEDDKPSRKNIRRGVGKPYNKKRKEGTTSKLELHLNTRGGRINLEVDNKALSEEKEKEERVPKKEGNMHIDEIQGKNVDGSEKIKQQPRLF